MCKRILFVVALLASPTTWSLEYLVKFKPEGYAQILSMHGFQVEDLQNKAKLLKLDIPKENVVSVVAQLYQQWGVEYVVPNARVHAFEAPLEEKTLLEQWHLGKIRAREAWEKAGNRGSRQIKVAVIDTGVDYKHPSLVDNMIPGFDFHQNDNDPMDITSNQNPGHGTHCAGLVGATGVQEGGVIGVSPEVSIIPIRFLNENGGGDLNNGIKAIDYAIEKKVDIISASWGATISRSQAQPLIEAIERAEKAGIIFIAAAANDGRNNDKTEVYPSNANLPNFISVAASGPNDEKPQWSNYGSKTVHVAAPGLNIMSTVPQEKFVLMSGTSMATPVVSGLVAFLKAQDPSLTGAQVKAILQTTGANVNISTQCDCRVDALAATEMILDKKMYLVPAAGTYAPGDEFQVKAYNTQGDITFASSNEAVLKVASNGTLKAGEVGDATITATDANGIQAFSKVFHIGAAKSKPGEPDPGDPGDPGMPGDGECPVGDQATCDAICAIMPEAPWCGQKAI